MVADESLSTQRRIPIRTKLLVGLAVPVVFVALISGFQVSKAQGNLNRTKDEVALAMIAGGPTTYITALLDERNISALDVLGLAGAIKLARVKDVADARSKTDAAQAQFERTLDKGPSEARALYDKTFNEARSKLKAVRDDVDAVPKEQRNTEFFKQNEHLYDDYTVLISGFHDANATVSRRIDDAELRNRAGSIAAQTRSSDLLSLLSRTAALSFLGQTELQDQLNMQARYTAFIDSRTAAIEDLASDPAAQKVMFGFYNRKPMKTFYGQVETFIEVGKIDDPTSVIKNAASTEYPNGTDAWQAARKSLQARGDALVATAQSSRNRYVTLFLFATLISLVVALAIARSIAKPLLSIADQAEDMARHRLPDAVGSVLATPIGQDIVEPELAPISVRSSDEVADVAASINVVQQRALELAVEQAVQRRNFADTFLNLGRRVQGLVARQLDFITELEDREDDPDVLADLFKLDHLATRIRRNAESLVVLAGVTRRQRRGEPAPILDALRSALGEVDEYTRVAIGQVDEARLPMSVAADLAHILAELIENGLNFSPPDSDVEVTGSRLGSGYKITVRDHGIGMTPEQVETANRRLSGNESFTVAPSRYMGHFVAGHLATGLGIDVRLSSTSGQGTLATVIVPEDLLAASGTAPAGRRSDDRPAPTGSAPDAAATRSAGQADTGQADTGTDRPGDDGPDIGDFDALRRSDRSTADESTATFKPEPPPAAPGSDSESLSSLLAVHRRLSRPRVAPEPERTPWAKSEDTPEDPGGAD